MTMHRILVVDDEADIRKLYHLELSDAGFEVRTAEDSARAMELVRQWSPDLVLLDIKLGEENGLELLRRLGELRRSILTVLITGYTGYKDDFTSWLADAHITKSVDTSELKRTVSELLASHADVG